MQQITIQLSDEEYKAINGVIADVTAWVQNAASNRARQAMFEIIEERTSLNPRKLSFAECINEISKLSISPKIADLTLVIKP